MLALRLLQRHLFSPVLSSSEGALIATFFIFRFGDHWRHVAVTAVTINGDEGQVGATDVASFTRDVALHPDFDPRFHRRIESAVYGRAQNDKVAHMHGH